MVPAAGLATRRRSSRVRAELSRASAVRRADFRVVERLLRADGLLQQLLRALEGDPGIDDGRLVLGHRRALQVGIEREERRAGCHRIAFAHGKRLDAARLVGADEDEIGLDPALELELGRVPAQIGVGGDGEADRRHGAHGENACLGRCHDAALPGPARQHLAMRAQQAGDVERIDPGEQAVPDHRQQQRRDDELGEARGRVAGELAAARGALGHRAHQADARARRPRDSRTRRSPGNAGPRR